MSANNFFYKISVVFLFKLSILVIKCEEKRKHEGTEIDIKDAPYTVHISPVGCTGALVDLYWVITAANCFEIMPEAMAIGLGASIKEKTLEHIRVKNVYLHPKYENITDPLEKVQYDIALVHLATPAVLSKSVKTLELEDTDWPKLEYRTCILAGYGWKLKKDLNRLHMSAMYATQGCDCIKKEKIICAQPFEEGDAPCYGDSGGILVCSNKGVAVTSQNIPAAYCSKSTKSTKSKKTKEPKKIQQHCSKNSTLYLFAYIKPQLQWFTETLTSNDNGLKKSNANILTAKSIQYNIIISVQLFALLMIFSS